MAHINRLYLFSSSFRHSIVFTGSIFVIAISILNDSRYKDKQMLIVLMVVIMLHQLWAGLLATLKVHLVMLLNPLPILHMANKSLLAFTSK